MAMTLFTAALSFATAGGCSRWCEQAKPRFKYKTWHTGFGQRGNVGQQGGAFVGGQTDHPQAGLLQIHAHTSRWHDDGVTTTTGNIGHSLLSAFVGHMLHLQTGKLGKTWLCQSTMGSGID